MTGCLCESELAEGEITRAARIVDGLAAIAPGGGDFPMAGEGRRMGARIPAVDRLERSGDASMELRSLAASQSFVECLGNQRVNETEA